MLLDHHFYWKSNEKTKMVFLHILPFGRNNETFVRILGNLLLTIWMQIDKGRSFTTERKMKIPKEDELIVQKIRKKYMHSSSKKNRNYARLECQN